MSQVIASARQGGASVWLERAKVLATWLVIAGLAFVIGAFMFAPSQQRKQATYLPSGYLSIATGVVSLNGAEDGPGALLPVRLADNSTARMAGFREVGESAVANQFLLYAQTRQTTSRASYNIEGVRVPLELAAFDAEGNLVSLTTTTPGENRVSIGEPHRWLLAAKAGTFTHYGVGQGTTINPDSIRKINL